ncbi:nucleotide exchange factor GrpE [Actinomadura oligospora]|uniref:nucleotide exchange factor GrpE n=1 Tax=Actinomadura oligospora TaxID=111804 RepID=UPI0004B303C9|nr:nucleotide exchange factor GrpE [Actinomadura oligospora]
MSSDRKREVSAGSRDERPPTGSANGTAPTGASAPGTEADETASATSSDDGDTTTEKSTDAADATTEPTDDGEDAAEAGQSASEAGAADGEATAVAREVRDALHDLLGRLDRETDRAAHRESVIDRLHEENQRLRRGELESMLEPVRAALYKVHDTLRQAAASPPEPEQAARLLGDCANEVADTLARTGSVRFEVEPGQPYDASRHRPVERVEVDDPDRDGTVVAVLTDGFEKGDRVVRKAGVRVGKSVKSDARRRTERDDGHRRPAR